MDSITDILQRTDARTLGRFLMEDRTSFDREVGEALTEKQIRLVKVGKIFRPCSGHCRTWIITSEKKARKKVEDVIE